jgi:hypothetical protein
LHLVAAKELPLPVARNTVGAVGTEHDKGLGDHYRLLGVGVGVGIGIVLLETASLVVLCGGRRAA